VGARAGRRMPSMGARMRRDMSGSRSWVGVGRGASGACAPSGGLRDGGDGHAAVAIRR